MSFRVGGQTAGTFGTADASTNDSTFNGNYQNIMGRQEVQGPIIPSGDVNNEISLEKFRVTQNSYGEIIFSWTVIDNLDLIDHFLILCKFQGITAPLGVAAKLPKINAYSFIDQETSLYIGTRQYYINVVLKTGQIRRFQKSITFKKRENLPKKFTIKLDDSDKNKNPGLRNDIKTAGNFYNEKMISLRVNKRINKTKFNQEQQARTIKKFIEDEPTIDLKNQSTLTFNYNAETTVLKGR